MSNKSSNATSTPSGTVGQDVQNAKRKLIETSPDNAVVVGNMPTAQLMKLMQDAMSKLLDEKLENLPTKSDIIELNSNIDEIKNEVQRLSMENAEMKAEIKKLQEIKELDNRRIERLEEELNRKKLIIRGLDNQNHLYMAAKNLFKDVLKINSDLEIEMVKKLQNINGKMTILVELKSTKMVNEVLKNTKHLSGTTIFIERDLSGYRLENKKVMLQMKKELLKFDKNKKVGVRGHQIAIEGRIFYWNGKKELVCGQKTGRETLVTIYGDGIDNLKLDYDTLLYNLKTKNF